MRLSRILRNEILSYIINISIQSSQLLAHIHKDHSTITASNTRVVYYSSKGNVERHSVVNSF